MMSELDWWYEESKTKSTSPYYELREALRDNPVVISKRNNHMSWEELELNTLEEVRSGKSFTFLQDDQQMSFHAEQYCELVYLKVRRILISDEVFKFLEPISSPTSTFPYETKSSSFAFDK